MSRHRTDSMTLQVPARAPIHICQALLALLSAEEADKLDQQRIDELTHGPGGLHSSNTDAKLFLEDLGLISTDLALAPDVKNSRGDPERFKALLKARIRDALTQNGCETEETAFFDSPFLSEKLLKDAVAKLSLFSKKDDPNNRIRGALVMLHKITVGVIDQASLRREFESRSRSRQQAGPTSSDAAEQDLSALLQKFDEVATVGKRFPMRMSQSGKITHWMHVYFDVRPTRANWLTLSQLAEEESRTTSE